MLLETDPVCHMQVMPETAAARTEYKGKTYYFCNQHCLERFQKNPEQYLGPTRIQLTDTPGVYVCPMHPEVRQMGPGACPKCGMALEPEVPQSAATGPDPELISMTQRFWVSLALSLPVAYLGMRHMHPSRAVQWVELALATPVVGRGA